MKKSTLLVSGLLLLATVGCGSSPSQTALPVSQTPTPTPIHPAKVVLQGRGLSGQYFGNPSFSGRASTQVDALLSFAWGESRPTRHLEAQAFSAMWSGQLVAPTTDTYTFRLASSGQTKLTIDGETVVAGSGQTGQIHLTAGQTYAIRLEYVTQQTTEQFLRLSWKTPQGKEQLVPTNVLYPDTAITGQALTGQAIPRDENLLVNGDFEQGAGGWIYEEWEYYDDYLYSNPRHTTTAQGQQGKGVSISGRFTEVQGQRGTVKPAYSYQRLPVELAQPGTKYVLSAWGKSPTGAACQVKPSVWLPKTWSDEVLPAQINNSSLNFSSNTWERKEVEFVMPATFSREDTQALDETVTTLGASFFAGANGEQCEYDGIDIRVKSSADPIPGNEDGESIGPDMTYGSPIALEFPVINPSEIAYFDIYGLGDDAYLGSNFRWSFGDGSTATGDSVQHKYEKPGTYTVSLDYLDGAGQPKHYETQVASIEMADIVSAPATSDSMTVKFDAGPEIPGLVYEYDFGDGTTATGSKQEHTFDKIGTYTYTLSVKDYRGQQGPLTAQGLHAQSGEGEQGRIAFQRRSFQTIWQRPPKADFTWSGTGTDYPTAPMAIMKPGENQITITFDASSAYDDHRNISPRELTYEWSFGDGATATGKVVSHTYTLTKPYPVTLKVTNRHGLTDTKKLYFHVRDFRYNTNLRLAYKDGLGSQSIEGMSYGDPDNGLTTQGLEAQAVYTMDGAPGDENTPGLYPFVLPPNHKFLGGFHQPLGPAGTPINSLCNSYKLSTNNKEWNPLVNSLPDVPTLCNAMVIGTNQVPTLPATGWQRFVIATSVGFSETNINTFHHLSVPRVRISVLPDELIPGDVASPVVKQYRGPNPDTGVEENFVDVHIRESELVGGKARIKVPVYAVNYEGQRLTRADGLLKARFTRYSEDTEGVTLINGEGQMEVEIPIPMFDNEAHEIDLTDITYFGSAGGCNEENDPLAAVSKHHLNGCSTGKAKYDFPTSSALDHIPPLPDYMSEYYKIGNHIVYGTSLRTLARSIRRDWEIGHRKDLELVDNFIPILIKERVDEYLKAADKCYDDGDCTLDERASLWFQGLTIAADVAPAGGELAKAVENGSTALGKVSRQNIDEARAGTRDFSSHYELAAKGAGETTIKGLNDCASRVCFDSFNNATSILTAKGFESAQALNKFDLELYEVQKRNKDNDYNVTKPDEFAEAEWRTISDCSIVRSHSFVPDTLVHAATGLMPISQLHIGDKVLAYNEATSQNGYYPITAVHRHDDPSITTLKLQTPDGTFETVTTTPEHPFYVTVKVGNGLRPRPIGHEDLNERWVGAGHLVTGDKLKLADGREGSVVNVTTRQQTQEMFNLTVAEAHTFFVGTQGWLVHNAVPSLCEVYRVIGEGLAKYHDKFTPTSHVLPDGRTTNPLVHILMGERKKLDSLEFGGGHHYDSLIGQPKLYGPGTPPSHANSNTSILAKEMIKDSASPSGFTYIDSNGHPLGPVPRSEGELHPNGVYNVRQMTTTVGTGEVLRKNNKEGTTFFPDSWSAERVIDELAGSLSTARSTANGLYEATTPSGVKVLLRLDSHQRIYMGYPAWPQ